MQQNSVSVSLYPQWNISEQHLSIFYRNSKAQRTLRTRERVLKNFRVHTAEQAEIFENMLEVVFTDSYRMLKKQYPLLSATERIMLSFIRIGLSEEKISRNMGLTIEELRRQNFIICKKLKTSAAHLSGLVHSILQ